MNRWYNFKVFLYDRWYARLGNNESIVLDINSLKSQIAIR